MIILRNIKLPLDTNFSNLKEIIFKKIKAKNIKTVKLYKKAIDARNKDNIFFNCTFLVQTDNDEKIIKSIKSKNAEIYQESPYIFPECHKKGTRPVVIGFGPAGMFASLTFARAGLCPVVIERGNDAETRAKDVKCFFDSNILNTESNIQFGEGGAGTFSDGKLNTGIKDPRIRAVLNEFVKHGAPENILYDAKPHIGTDILINVVKSIRKEIIYLGGEVLFNHKLVGIEEKDGKLFALNAQTVSGIKTISCNRAVLAIGHSARDTFEMLKIKGFNMEPKSFAVGVRIEHLQEEIDKAQYGRFAGHKALGAADYKLAAHLQNGRGVFTFCMCPGGEVVNASSELNRVAINGMSNSKRNGANANSAVLVGISPEDFYKKDVLDGMYLQRQIEERAFILGKNLPVSQYLGDFLGLQAVDKKVIPSVKTGSTFGNINEIFPEYISSSLKEGIMLFDRKLKGFASSGAVITAPETRSSSPIRILRNMEGMSSLAGMYPCGEGAGYAGGITSAAVDGLRIAEKVISQIENQ